MQSKTLLFMLAGVALLIPACKRPQPLGTQPLVPPRAQEAQHESTSPAPTTGASVQQPNSPTPQPSLQAKPANALVAEYQAERDLGKQQEILADLQHTPAAEGVAAIGKLLVFEKRAELRVAMLDSLDSFDGEETAKLALLRSELFEHRAIGESRDAAIDALLNIQDRAAIPIWQGLLQDPDDALRDIARQAITSLESL